MDDLRQSIPGNELTECLQKRSVKAAELISLSKSLVWGTLSRDFFLISDPLCRLLRFSNDELCNLLWPIALEDKAASEYLAFLGLVHRLTVNAAPLFSATQLSFLKYAFSNDLDVDIVDWQHFMITCVAVSLEELEERMSRFVVRSPLLDAAWLNRPVLDYRVLDIALSSLELQLATCKLFNNPVKTEMALARALHNIAAEMITVGNENLFSSALLCLSVVDLQRGQTFAKIFRERSGCDMGGMTLRGFRNSALRTYYG